MKKFISALLFACAQATDYFTGRTVTNALEADKAKTVLLKDADNAEIWSIETISVQMSRMWTAA
mgnify:CR=1 FL=1